MEIRQKLPYEVRHLIAEYVGSGIRTNNLHARVRVAAQLINDSYGMKEILEEYSLDDKNGMEMESDWEMKWNKDGKIREEFEAVEPRRRYHFDQQDLWRYVAAKRCSQSTDSLHATIHLIAQELEFYTADDENRRAATHIDERKVWRQLSKKMDQNAKWFIEHCVFIEMWLMRVSPKIERFHRAWSVNQASANAQEIVTARQASVNAQEIATARQAICQWQRDKDEMYEVLVELGITKRAVPEKRQRTMYD
jgi:hypothetical protein